MLVLTFFPFICAAKLFLPFYCWCKPPSDLLLFVKNLPPPTMKCIRQTSLGSLYMHNIISTFHYLPIYMSMMCKW